MALMITNKNPSTQIIFDFGMLMVNSRLQYGILVWGTANTSNLNALKKDLNKILKIMLSSDIYTPVSKLYCTLDFLKLDDICKLELKLMHQLQHLKFPEIFTKFEVEKRDNVNSFDKKNRAKRK